MAFFGGICGLCLGFSLLSGAELIYWLTFGLFIEAEERRDDAEEDKMIPDTILIKKNKK